MKTPFISADGQAKPAEKRSVPAAAGASTGTASPQPPAAHVSSFPSGLGSDGSAKGSEGVAETTEHVVCGEVHGVSAASKTPSVPDPNELRQDAEAIRHGFPRDHQWPASLLEDAADEIAKLKHDLINAEAMRVGFNHLVAKMDPLAQFVRSIHTIAHRPFLNGTELAIQTELKGLLDEVNR